VPGRASVLQVQLQMLMHALCGAPPLRGAAHTCTVQALVWVIVGVFLYLGIAAAAILHVWNMRQASKLEFVTGQYFPTHRLGYAVTVERGIWATASFVIWFRLLKCAPAECVWWRGAPMHAQHAVRQVFELFR
jgi:hypothetical protein